MTLTSRTIRIGIIIFTVISIIIITSSNRRTGIEMMIGVVLLGAICLITTTRFYRLMQALGMVVAIVGIWLFVYEGTLFILRDNCILFSCEASLTDGQKQINQYSAYLQTLYPDDDWVKQFSIEMATMLYRTDKIQHYPYIGFRESPYDGEFAYVDSQGLRPIPQSECDPDDYYVVTMGNSALWSQYSPNHGTISALIQEELATAMSRPVCVISYAQGAWNSTQSVIQLVNLIQLGDIPDLVIFYDGAVDVLSAVQYKDAHIPFLTQDIAQAIGEINQEHSPEINLYLWFRKTAIGTVIVDTLLKSNRDYTPTIPIHLPAYLKASDEIMGMSPAEQYLTNYQLVTHLAEAYDFEFATFVQPVSFYGERALTPKEQLDIKDGWLSNPEYDIVFRETYASLSDTSETLDHLYFLGNLFDGMSQEIYGDPIHTLPEFNRMIAVEIADTIIADYLTQ